MKRHKLKIKTIKKRQIFPMKEEGIERFFPKVSHMGSGIPSQWRRIKIVSTQKSVKAPL